MMRVKARTLREGDMGITLEDGSRVGVIGGGPAGSMFAYFVLNFAELMDLDVGVDIYEPRDFSKPGPGGCNMCGGIISESLVQALAVEGIELPTTVVQRGIDSYVLHTDETKVNIETPLEEKRIAALHRGGGPRDVKDVVWGGLDGHLLKLAQGLGTEVIPTRVREVDRIDGRPRVRVDGTARKYDLLVGATGVNSGGWDLFESLGFRPKRPKTTKAYITELNLGEEAVTQYFGSAMHVFLLDLPRLDCAAMIPKGQYVTVCLLGTDVDRDLINAFFANDAVRRCLPETFDAAEGACHCLPKINIREAAEPYLDRAVLVGDCGVTRLYKDGIGAAYRTAKAAARTAVFSGVSAADFRKHYRPAYKSIASDNRYGLLTFSVVHWIKLFRPMVRGVLKMVSGEQAKPGAVRRMSIVLWDMFTGSAPYRDIFFRTLDPRFVSRFMWESAVVVARGGQRKGVDGTDGAL
jgi:flavin-dependent dehydrogenase